MGCTLSVNLPPGSLVLNGENGEKFSAPSARAPGAPGRTAPADGKTQLAQHKKTNSASEPNNAVVPARSPVQPSQRSDSGSKITNLGGPKTTQDYLEYHKEQVEKLEHATDEVFDQISTLKKLSEVHHASVLKAVHKCLWEAAGKPPTREVKLADHDMSTWTFENIAQQQMDDCVQLVEKHKDTAGEAFKEMYTKIPNKTRLAVSSLKGNALNLEPEIGKMLFPIDKQSQDVTHNQGRLFEFALDVQAFEGETSGDHPNDREHLQKLLSLMKAKIISERGLSRKEEDKIKEEDTIAVLSLYSSPVNSVTLEPAARAAAKIPLQASFYSFCYPYEFQSKDKQNNYHGEQVTADQLVGMGIKVQDPFVCWLLYGGFVYFNHIYDILSINAINFERKEGEVGFSLNLGMPTEMLTKHGSVQELIEKDRFRPVTNTAIEKDGITEFAWITPSEMVGKTIFTRSGGFAYKFGQGRDARYLFFPVVPPSQLKKLEPTVWESPVHIPEYLQYYKKYQRQGKNLLESVEAEGKYMPDVSSLAYGDGEISALGLLHLLGLASSDVTSFEGGDEGVDTIRKEFEELAKASLERSGSTAKIDTQEDWINFEYVMKGRTPDGNVKVMGNDGIETERDRGRDRSNTTFDLDFFWKHKEARQAELTKGEVLALRLYTSSSFRSINIPLRNVTAKYTKAKKEKPNMPWAVKATKEEIPLPATTYFISTALKKLRVQNMSGKKFRSTELWRGMKNLTSSEAFVTHGGAEGACMSTTPDLRVVANYSKSDSPLLLKIKIESPMDHGADISWLSIFPDEKEVLYPPLTFLKPLRVQPIRDLDGKGEVITVKPSFPS